MTYKTQVKSGKLLLAEPEMSGDPFSRSVILLCEHRPDGSFGLILNKPIENRLSEVVERKLSFDLPLNYGGPCENNTLHFVHRFAHLTAATDLGGGLFWGGHFNGLLDYLEANPDKTDQVKFFIGYSGWDRGQLAGELNEKTWIVGRVPPQIDLLLEPDTDDELWRTCMLAQEKKIGFLANSPIDPTLN